MRPKVTRGVSQWSSVHRWNEGSEVGLVKEHADEREGEDRWKRQTNAPCLARVVDTSNRIKQGSACRGHP